MDKKRKNGLVLSFDNGGSAAYDLRKIKSYNTSWVSEYDTSNAFDNYDFTKVSENYLGQRFSANITTSFLTEDEVTNFLRVLGYRVVTLNDNVEFNGLVQIDNVSRELVEVTPKEKYYRLSFTAVAVALNGGSGGL